MLSGFLGAAASQPARRQLDSADEGGDELHHESSHEDDGDFDMSSEEEDSDDSMTRDLEGIGTFTGFRMPSFWSTEDSKQQSLSRREQLSTFIDDLKSGFSFQSALDRFQTIRVLLESQVDAGIQNSVDLESDTEDNYEPQVIKPATEPKDIPLLDQVIIPQIKEPGVEDKKHRRHNHHHRRKQLHNPKPTNSEAEELTHIDENEMNDEMLLRKRIVKIRQLEVTEDEKNRLVQKLMMGAHYAKVRFVDENGEEVFQITTDSKEADKKSPLKKEINDVQDEDDDMESDDGMASDEEVIVNDEDKIPQYHDEQETQLGCQHYQRNCKMECPKCKKWFGCPLCHDEVITDHSFKRKDTKHVMCMECQHVQAPTEFCDNCDNKFALYFCSKCKLYDNDETKDIYHCDGCGICRLGLGLGQDFFHCDGCNACLAIELQDDHKCIERATQSDCPICGEFMFTSFKSVVFMSCGHAIHQTCFDDHSRHSYKCPTCQKTVLNMEAQFRVLDMEISLQPLPYPYSQWSCVVSCNDCNAKSSSPYHVLGLKCDNCKSYNTVQVKLIKPEENDYDSDISTTTNLLRRANIVRGLRTIPISSNLLNTNYNIENGQIPETNDSSSQQKANQEPSDVEAGGGRTLTLPQQLLNNIDNYVNNLELSSEDEDEEDELDFLRVNKTLKSMKHDLTSDDDDNNIAGSPSALSSRFLTNKIKDLIRSGRAMMDEDNFDESDDEPYESDEFVNGF